MTRRVWHVYLTPRVGRVNGVIGALAALAPAQAREGVEVSVLVAGAPPVIDGTTVVARERPLDALRWVRDTLAQGSPPDLVHFHEVLRPPHRIVTALLARHGIPFVVSPHAGLAPPNLARYRWRKALYGAAVERRLLARAGAISCLTPLERDDVLRALGTRAPECVVIPNAIARRDAPLWAPRAGRHRLVTLCRYDVRHKGLDRLVVLARALPDVDVAVYGAPDQNEPARLDALRRDAPRNFSLRSPVRGADKDAVLAGSTMFVQPSRWEGLSMALLEALSRGVPTAVSRYVAQTLPYKERSLGLVLSDDDTVAAQQVRAALADGTALAAWSARGRRLATEDLDPAAVAAQTLALYERVTRRASVRR